MGRRVLFLDLGTTTGYAMADDGIIMFSGSIRLPKDNSRYERFYNFLVENRGFNEIVTEAIIPNPKMPLSILPLAKFEGLVEMFCEQNRIPHTNDMSPISIRKTFLGRGHRGKLEKWDPKLETCNKLKKLGWSKGEYNTTRDHDEADALALACAYYMGRSMEYTVDC